MNADQSAEDAAFASDVDVKQRKYMIYGFCMYHTIDVLYKYIYVQHEGDGLYIDAKKTIANHR